MRPRTLLALAVTAAFAACDSSPGSRPEGLAAVNSAKWTVDASPLRSISGTFGVDSLTPFGDVVGAARFSDGGFAIADGHTLTLEFFSRRGDYLRTVGGKGIGASQFARLTDVLRCGDSLYVRDLELRQYKVFSSDGTMARRFALPLDSSGLEAVSSACNANATFIHYARESNEDLPLNSQVRRLIVPFWLSGPTGSRQANLGSHHGLERWFVRTAGGVGFTTLPLGKVSLVAIGNSRAYIGTADSFAIDVYALNGNHTGVIRKAVNTHATTPADIERYKLRDTTGVPADRIEYKKREWQTMEFSRTLPAYTALIVDSADNLWVREQPLATGEFVEWVIFSPSGAELAHIDLPQSFHVYEIGSDYVLGGTVDPVTGIQIVRSLALNRAP